MPLVIDLIAASVTIANKAGTIIRDIMKKGDLKTIDKGVQDFQTEADRLAQKMIVFSLNKLFPKVTIIGEEENLDSVELTDDQLEVNLDKDALSMKCPIEFEAVKDEDIVVWVDPLDGTSEYVHGFLDHVTVLIGISVKGKAIAGVINQPFYNYQNQQDPSAPLGRTIYGLVGSGVKGMTRAQDADNKRIIVTTRSHYNKHIQETISAMKPDEELRVGGAGNKALYVIEGKASAYLYPQNGCKKWDTCAPDAILKAAGGLMTDCFGNELQYDKNAEYPNKLGVISAYPSSELNYYLERIPDDVKIKLIERSKC